MKKLFKKYSHQKEFIEKVEIIATTSFKYVVFAGVILFAAYQVLNVALQIFVQLVVIPRLQGLL